MENSGFGKGEGEKDGGLLVGWTQSIAHKK